MKRIRIAAASLFLLLTTALVTVSAQRSGPRAFDWSTCSISEREGTVRELQCPEFRLRLMRGPTLANTEGLTAIARSSGLGTNFREDELHVGRTTAPMLVGPRSTIVVPMPNVIAACSDADSERRGRCIEAVTSLVRTRRLPPGVEFPRARLEFLGRALEVPQGCSLVGSERIVCERTGSALDWREQALARGRTVESTIDAYVSLLESRLTIESNTAVSCSMHGVAARGRRIRASASGASIDILACGIARDGKISFAGCMGTFPSGRRLPTPCDQVFDAPSR